MSRPTPEELISDWQRRKAVKAAEREVVEAAENWAEAVDAPRREYSSANERTAYYALLDAVSKLREAREK